MNCVEFAEGQQRELVASQASQDVVGAQETLEALRKVVEHEVAGVVAKRVVDLLEPIEVHHHHDGELVGSPFVGRGQLAVDDALKGRTVGEAGERVVACLELDAVVQQRFAQVRRDLLGQRLQTLDVDLAEATLGPNALGDDDEPDHTLSVADRSTDHTADFCESDEPERSALGCAEQLRPPGAEYVGPTQVVGGLRKIGQFRANAGHQGTVGAEHHHCGALRPQQAGDVVDGRRHHLVEIERMADATNKTM